MLFFFPLCACTRSPSAAEHVKVSLARGSATHRPTSPSLLPRAMISQALDMNTCSLLLSILLCLCIGSSKATLAMQCLGGIPPTNPFSTIIHPTKRFSSVENLLKSPYVSQENIFTSSQVVIQQPLYYCRFRTPHSVYSSNHHHNNIPPAFVISQTLSPLISVSQ